MPGGRYPWDSWYCWDEIGAHVLLPVAMVGESSSDTFTMMFLRLSGLIVLFGDRELWRSSAGGDQKVGALESARK